MRLGVGAWLVVVWASAASFPSPAFGDGPCDGPAFHKLDFWVGTWAVFSDGKLAAESRIQRLGAGCGLLEMYRQGDGYGGKSLSYVDPDDGCWRQVWVDSGGSVSEFREVSDGDGVLEWEGETRRDGGRVLRRMRLARSDEKGVRQSSQISRDVGRTWEALYDLQYRVAPPAGGPLTCSAPPSAEAEAVRAVAVGIVEADNAADLPRVLSYYAESAVLLPPRGEPVAGLRAIRPRYERLFAEFAPAIEPHLDRVCVAQDVAFVEGRNSGRLARRDGGADRVLADEFLMVVRRDASSRWRISHLAWWPPD